MEKYFDKFGNFNGYQNSGTFPPAVIKDCTHAGPCDEDVKFWQAKLNFECPRDLAVEYLAHSGAWTREELGYCSALELNQRVLWFACGEINDNGEWFGLIE